MLGRGVRGLKASFEVVPAGFALLYPPYGSPSPRGWGKEVQGEVSCRESEGVPQVSLQYPPRLGARGLKMLSWRDQILWSQEQQLGGHPSMKGVISAAT